MDHTYLSWADFFGLPQFLEAHKARLNTESAIYADPQRLRHPDPQYAASKTSSDAVDTRFQPRIGARYQVTNLPEPAKQDNLPERFNSLVKTPDPVWTPTESEYVETFLGKYIERGSRSRHRSALRPTEETLLAVVRGTWYDIYSAEFGLKLILETAGTTALHMQSRFSGKLEASATEIVDNLVQQEEKDEGKTLIPTLVRVTIHN